MNEHIVWPPDQPEQEVPPRRQVFHLHSGDAVDDPARPLHPALEAMLRQPGAMSTDAAREMIHTMQRRRRAAEERSASRARWIRYSLCSAAILIGIGAVLTPNPSWSAVLGTLSMVCVAVAGGMWLRGRL